ncbi:hypothetical protein [Methylomonas sp. AM2-LC]|uniref:hypothetical protein n=1 Tax=Methylomonas sp. AM2-LC TaxID=3153301 RepID=UPI00326474D0
MLIAMAKTSAQRKAAQRQREKNFGLTEVRGIIAPSYIHQQFKKQAESIMQNLLEQAFDVSNLVFNDSFRGVLAAHIHNNDFIIRTETDDGFIYESVSAEKEAVFAKNGSERVKELLYLTGEQRGKNISESQYSINSKKLFELINDCWNFVDGFIDYTPNIRIYSKNRTDELYNGIEELAVLFNSKVYDSKQYHQFVEKSEFSEFLKTF